ncbi:MAG: hypothetical protein MZU84_06460 [Sphingobacterium sp.]|nr:hypothetical protein [Sphingobacterium sp.]
MAGPVVTGKAQEGAAVFWWTRLLLDARRPLAGDGRPAFVRPRDLDRATGDDPRRSGHAPRRRRHRPPRRGRRPGPRGLHLLLHPPLRALRRTPSPASTAPPSRSRASSSATARLALRPRHAVPAGPRPAERASSRRTGRQSPLALETPDAQARRRLSPGPRARPSTTSFRPPSTAIPSATGTRPLLPSRFAFCMRDVSHQATGAHVLGLAAFNRNMLDKFARAVSPSRDYCSYWEIDKWNRPAPVDYKSDRDFWYNLTANFDVLDACWRQYSLDRGPCLSSGPGLPRVLSPDGQGIHRGLGQGRRRHPRAPPRVRISRPRRLRRRAVLGPGALRLRPHRRHGPGLRFLRRACSTTTSRRKGGPGAAAPLLRPGRTPCACAYDEAGGATSQGQVRRRPRPGRRTRLPGRHLERRLPALLRLRPGRPAARGDPAPHRRGRRPRASRSSPTCPRSSTATAADEAAYARLLALADPAKARTRIPRGAVAPSSAPSATGLMGVRPDAPGADRRDPLRAHGRRRPGPSSAACRSSTPSSTSATTAATSSDAHPSARAGPSSGEAAFDWTWDALAGRRRRRAERTTARTKRGRPVSWVLRRARAPADGTVGRPGAVDRQTVELG